MGRPPDREAKCIEGVPFVFQVHDLWVKVPKKVRCCFSAALQPPVVVAAEQVESVIGAITEAAGTGRIGDGKIFVMPLQEAIRIRTGERGASAV